MLRAAMKFLGPIAIRLGLLGTVAAVGPGAIVQWVGFVPALMVGGLVSIGLFDLVFVLV